MNYNQLINLSSFVIFLICIIIYSIYLLYGIKKPGTSKRGLLNIFYGQWVNRVINPKDTIIAVQTMRNLIMATTFLSSAMLLLLGLLMRIPSIGLEDMITLSLTSNEIIAQYKLLLFVAVIIFSIIMFLLSLRQMVRFSILIGIPIESIEEKTQQQLDTKVKKQSINAEEIRKKVFIRAMNRFTFGMRAVFYGITLIFWFVNVYAFILGTLTLTAYLLLHQDIKTPRLEEIPV